MRAHLVESPAGVVVVLPAALASLVASLAASDLQRRAQRDGVRPDPVVTEALAVMRRARLAADLAAADRPTSEPGSAPHPLGHDHGMLTTARVARRLGVTARRVRQMIAAGAFPGARRHGNAWAIPAAEVA